MSSLDRSQSRAARTDTPKESRENTESPQLEAKTAAPEADLAARRGRRWSTAEETQSADQSNAAEPPSEVVSEKLREFTKEAPSLTETLNRFDRSDGRYLLFEKNRQAKENGKFYYAAMGTYVETMASVYDPEGTHQLDMQTSQEAIRLAREGQGKEHGIPDGLFAFEGSPPGSVDGLIEVKAWKPERVSDLAQRIREGRINLSHVVTDGVDVPGYKYKIQALSHQNTAESLYEAFQEGKLEACGITAVAPPEQMVHMYRFPADVNHADAQYVIEQIAKEAGLKPEQAQVDFLPWTYAQSHQQAHAVVGRMNDAHKKLDEYLDGIYLRRGQVKSLRNE